MQRPTASPSRTPRRLPLSPSQNWPWVICSPAHVIFPSRATPCARAEWEKKAYGKGIELQGKTLGIVGFGRIGQHLGVMAKAIGMTVIAFDIFHIPGIEEQLGIPYVEMDELLAKSDFISVHAPAVDGGALINAERIAKMKDGVCIINTSRGTNVDEAALLAALESGKVRAAGLDVYADEPASNSRAVLPSDGLLHAAYRRCHR